MMEAGERRGFQPHALRDALVAEICAPRPRRDRQPHLVMAPDHAHLAGTAKSDRPPVALIELVDSNHIGAGLYDLFRAERDVHLDDMRRVEQAANMLLG